MEIISAKYLLTLNNSDDPIEDGAIATELGKIAAIGTREELKKEFPNALEIKHPERILMPGLVNAHCYLDLTNYYIANKALIADQPTNADYIDWLVETIKYRKTTATTQMTF